MAEYWPIANGIWSTRTNWLTAENQEAGSLPMSGDDVYADGKTIFIDIDTSVNSINTAARPQGSLGGGFILNNNISLTANSVIPGSTTCLSFVSASPSSATIYGNIYGSLIFSSGYGLDNTSTGRIDIIGTCEGRKTQGVFNSSTGTIFINKIVGAPGNFELGYSPGLSNSQNGSVYVKEIEFGARGTNPITGPIFVIPTDNNTVAGYTSANQLIAFFEPSLVPNTLPPVSSVKFGTIYSNGTLSGTMILPPASATQIGILIGSDGTEGTAFLSLCATWSYNRLSGYQQNSFGEILNNVATIQSIAQQIESFS